MFTDPRDGKVYKTVKIGEQIWLAQNLNYEAEGSLCYDNDPANAEKYGRLYDFETAKKDCPHGWHLPSNDEWNTLVNAVGGEDTAGKYLKTNSGWIGSGNGTDSFGFSALPGGDGYPDCSFSLVGNQGIWWSADYAYIWYMEWASKCIYYCNYAERFLFSVRCIKD